jgi:hypothetical protein
MMAAALFARADPTGPTVEAGLNAEQRALVETVRDELARAIRAGLAHVQAATADGLSALGVETRMAGLPLLGRLLATAAGQASALAARRDDLSEAELTSAFAQVWGLTRALEQAPPDIWPQLRGSARRSYTSAYAPAGLDLIPLGATWWQTVSGAKGFTLTVWDGATATAYFVTSARPPGTDASFGPDPNSTVFWGVPLSTLLAGPFRLAGPRVSDSGTISPTGARATPLERGFEAEVLDGIVHQMTAELDQPVGFGRPERPVRLLAADGTGELELDEPAQELVWALPLADGDWATLRQPVNRVQTGRVEALTALAGGERPIRYVLAERVAIRSRPVWQPVSVFLGERDLELFSLDFDLTRHLPAQRRTLRRRLRALTTRHRPPPAPTPVGAVTLAVEQVSEVVVPLTATGRPRLTAAERTRCRDLATRLDDLALHTLATALRQLEPDCPPENLLKAQFLADRLIQIEKGRA